MAKRIAKTIGDLAAELQVSSRLVDRYLAAGMREACELERGYSVARAKEWRAENVGRSTRDQAGAQLLQEKHLAEIAKIEQDVRAKTLKNDALEGRMLMREDVEQQSAELCLRIKQRLEMIPDELENEFPKEHRLRLKRALADRIRLILVEMSGWTFDDGTEPTETDELEDEGE